MSSLKSICFREITSTLFYCKFTSRQCTQLMRKIQVYNLLNPGRTRCKEVFPNLSVKGDKKDKTKQTEMKACTVLDKQLKISCSKSHVVLYVLYVF